MMANRSLPRLRAWIASNQGMLYVGVAIVVAALIAGNAILFRRTSGLSPWVDIAVVSAALGGVFVGLLTVRRLVGNGMETETTRALAAVAALIAVAAITAYWSGLAPQDGVRPALLMIAVSGAATLVGGFLGFLFGLPRFDYTAREGAAVAPSTTFAVTGGSEAPVSPGVGVNVPGTRSSVRYRPSANLEEIADWLSKTIIGLSLTQITRVGEGLDRVATYVVSDCGGACPQKSLVASTVVFGGVGGLFFGYLWTRLRYVKLAATVDVDTRAIIDAEAADAFGVGGKSAAGPTAMSAPADAGAASGATDAAADPNKTKFGESAQRNDRALRASISRSAISSTIYRVELTVASTNTANPLTGSVIFHLHPTFRKQIVEQPVVNGVATLIIMAYGAFTVGAEADGGKTRLELDLAQNPDATNDFKSR